MQTRNLHTYQQEAIDKIKVLSLEQIAENYGITVDQLKAQYSANAEGLERMYNKAIEKGGKVGGLTAAELLVKVEQFKLLAQ